MANDAATLRKVRLLISDTGGNIWDEEEIGDFLDLEDGSVYGAAAAAMRSLAADRVRLAKATRFIDGSTEERAIQEVLDLAKSYEERADRAGCSGAADLPLGDEHLASFDPPWRGFC